MEHQRAYQRRKRCWLVFGRAVLTLSVLGLITVGLYVLSNRVHSRDPAAPATTESSLEFNARERREVRRQVAEVSGGGGEVGGDEVEEKFERILYKNEADKKPRRRFAAAVDAAEENGSKGYYQWVNQKAAARRSESGQQHSENQIVDSEDFYDAGGNNSTEIIYGGAGEQLDLFNETNGGWYEEKVRHKKNDIIYPASEHYVYVRRYKCSKKPHYHRKGITL